MIARYAGKTVLAIGAHPDDLEIGVGGTLAELSRRGARVIMAIICVPSELETRIAESRQAAEILGCEMRVMVRDHCCRVEDMKLYEVVSMTDALVKEYRPAALFTHGTADFHNDHLLVNQACMSTQRLGYFDVFCYYPASCRPVPVRFQPDVYVDVTATIDRKQAAIDCHSSQFMCRGIETGFLTDVAKLYGVMTGVEYAEGLKVHRLLLS
jgi:N-acetylglucosamine malate deacetylase 1